MSGRPGDRRLIGALLPAVVAAAILGLWSWQETAGLAAPRSPRGGEAWLAEPLPPLALAPGAQPPDSAAQVGIGRSPFLNAAEQARHGRPAAPFLGLPVSREVASPSAPKVATSYPDLRAVIRCGDQSVVLLSASPARVGEQVQGVEVLEVEGQRVLVKTGEGQKWLQFSAP